MKTKPYRHQLEGLEKSKGCKSFAYLMEMGTGKSWCLLADAERAYNELEIDCLVVLAPKGVYRNWSTKEVPTHLSIPHEIFVWSSTFSEKQERKFNSGILCKNYRLKVVLVNIEALISKRVFNFGTKLLKSLNCMLAIDESTIIKNPASQRTKAALDLAPLAKYRRVLTGSPITKSPYDLYSQSLFLDEKFSGFSTFLAYRHYYAIIEKGYGNSMVMRWNPETRKKEMVRLTYEKVVGYKNLDKLNARIQPWSYRCLKKDCLDLPEKVYLSRDVELTDEQIKAYNSMKDQWIIEVGAGSCTASIALVKSLKLHQILCGHVKNDNGEMLIIPQKRTQALLQVLEESSDQKVIIFCKYKQDAINIKAALAEVYGEESIVEFHGAVSDKDREIAKTRIQEDDTCHFFIGSKAACRGLTLTACTLMIFYSYDYDYEAWTQAEDRIHRIGMTSCTIIHLKVPDSIDETILLSHKTKEAVADEILTKVKTLGQL